MSARLLPLLLLALCTACAGGSTSPGSAPSTSAPSSAAPAGGTALRAQVQDSPQAAVRTVTLTCDPPGGSVADPAAACAALARLDAPFEPLPRDNLCSQIYSGPQTAHVTGTWRGRSVDLHLSRTDGCRTAQWDDYAPLVGTAS